MMRRAWTVESGQASGLRLRFPQNAEYIRGVSERPVQEAIARHLRPGQTFYDVGANIGFFSLIAARLVGPAGRVCAFEPLAEHVRTIRANAGLNHMPHVTAFEVAAGNREGFAELLLTQWDGGAALEMSPVRPESPSATQRVRVVTLDDFAATEKLPPPDMVKIDVEGVEREVLEGLSATIARHRPILLYEIDDGDAASFRARRQALDGYVAALGYEVRHLEGSYPGMAWHVGHSLALPRQGQGSASQ